MSEEYVGIRPVYMGEPGIQDREIYMNPKTGKHLIIEDGQKLPVVFSSERKRLEISFSDKTKFR